MPFHYPCSDKNCEDQGVVLFTAELTPNNCFCGKAVGGKVYYSSEEEDEFSSQEDRGKKRNYHELECSSAEEDPRKKRWQVQASSGGEWTSSSEEEDSEDEDYVPPGKGKKDPRPLWNPGRREQVKGRQTSPGGTLTCGICNRPIAVNANGKEEWVSKSGKQHETSPHVDHYAKDGKGGDWVDRLNKLRKDKAFQMKSETEQKKMARKVYNDSPLRTTHGKCNCARPKSHFN